MSFNEKPLVSGDKRILNFQVKKNNAVINITNYQIKMAVWGGPLDFELTTPTDIVITDAAAGMFSVTVSSERTAGLLTEDVVCDVEIQFAPPGDGPFTPLDDGKWKIKKGKINP